MPVVVALAVVNMRRGGLRQQQAAERSQHRDAGLTQEQVSLHALLRCPMTRNLLVDYAWDEHTSACRVRRYAEAAIGAGADSPSLHILAH